MAAEGYVDVEVDAGRFFGPDHRLRLKDKGAGFTGYQ